jgi:hypothetical protein
MREGWLSYVRAYPIEIWVYPGEPNYVVMHWNGELVIEHTDSTIKLMQLALDKHK